MQAVMIGLFDANWKLDELLNYFEEDDEEEETDSP